MLLPLIFATVSAIAVARWGHDSRDSCDWHADRGGSVAGVGEAGSADRGW
jgi:hypothetical protein